MEKKLAGLDTILFDRNLFERLMDIRAFETTLLNLFSENKIGGTTHTSLGQELSGVLVGMLVTDQDIIISNHRCHAHYLGLTNDFVGLANELLGNSSGVNNGVGGSQHIAVPNRFYSNGIQGGMVSYSAGLAKRLSKENKGLVINFIGDGTFGEGALYEGMNMAKCLKAPVLFFIENNGIAQSTMTEDVICGTLEKKLSGFDIAYSIHEHDDVEGLISSIENYLNVIRETPSPKAIIWNCQRLGPHSKGDDTRSPEELSDMLNKDILMQYCHNNGLSYDKELSLSVEKVGKFFENITKDIRSHSSTPIDIAPKKLERINGKKSVNLMIDELNLTLQSFLANTEGIILGQDIIDPYGGAFKVTRGLSSLYPSRVLSTPISESAIVGFGIGYSSLSGTVIIEIMFGDFITLVADQVINHCSKFSTLHTSSAPSIIIRTPIGGGRGYGATHSHL